MAFRFERPANAVNQTEALNNADFHSYINQDDSPSIRAHNHAERPPELINVNAYFLIRNHEEKLAAQRAAQRALETSIHDVDIDTKAGKIDRFSGTETDLTNAQKKIDAIQQDVNEAIKTLASGYKPTKGPFSWGPFSMMVRDPDVDFEKLQNKAADRLTHAMTIDINTTFSLVLQNPDPDLRAVYFMAERRVGLAERAKQMQKDNCQ